MKRAAFVALLLAGIPLLTPTSRALAAEGLVWRSWDAGVREAESSNRPILVDVYTDWCGWCKRMDADVYSRTDVQQYLSKHFVTVKLNAESSGRAEYQGRAQTLRSLASSFGVSGYPTTVFLRSGGEHLVNVPGYIKAERFLLLLRYVGEGHLERGVQFGDFERSLSRPSKKGS